MNKKFALVSVLFGASLLAAEPAVRKAASRPAGGNGAVIITISGEINDVTLRSLDGRLKTAEEKYHPDFFILEIDTFGGLLKSALDITNRIRNSDKRIVAYVNPRAISAGAMIAVACNEIVMQRGSKMGDCAPIAMGQKLEGTEREKVESPTRTEFRLSAQRNGYNPLLAEAMVSDWIAVHKIHRKDDPKTVRYVGDHELTRLTGARIDPDTKVVVVHPEANGSDEKKPGRTYQWVFERTIVHSGQLLTMTDQEAVELGFAKTVVDGRSELAAYYGIPMPPVLEHSWSQRLAAFLASMEVRGILTLLLIVGVYLELNTPGIGVPGAVAAVCLCLMLGAPYLTGLANMWEILLIVAGIGLLMIEIFVIPGFGIAGISGITLVLLGLMLTFVQEPIAPTPFAWPSWEMFKEGIHDGLISLLIGLVGAIVVCSVLAKYFHRIPVLRTFQLTEGLSVMTPEEKAAGPFGGPALGGSITLKVGAEGVTESPLRPAGKARFGRELVDVVAEAQFIENHVPVEVIQVRGNRIVVKPTRAD